MKTLICLLVLLVPDRLPVGPEPEPPPPNPFELLGSWHRQWANIEVWHNDDGQLRVESQWSSWRGTAAIVDSKHLVIWYDNGDYVGMYHIDKNGDLAGWYCHRDRYCYSLTDPKVKSNPIAWKRKR